MRLKRSQAPEGRSLSQRWVAATSPRITRVETLKNHRRGLLEYISTGAVLT